MNTPSVALVLRRGDLNQRTLFKVGQGAKLLFKLHNSLVGLQTKVFCNLPPKDSAAKQFRRNEYYELPWISNSTCTELLKEVDSYVELSVTSSGSFRYYCALSESGYKEEVCSGYFVVDPLLELPDGTSLPLNGVCMQTVVTKHLGNVKDWLSRLQVSKETNYNMVHFTPVQHLGASNSAYSIKDQLAVDPKYDTADANEAWRNVKSVVDTMRNEWGLFSLTDVVLNHTSYDSPWIHEHPDAGFNLANSPHLKPAFVLDRLLWKLTLDIVDGKYLEDGIPSTPVTSESLDKIRAAFLNQVLPDYQIIEYFLADSGKLVTEFETKIRNLLSAPARQSSDISVQLIQDPNYRLFGCTVDMDAAVSKFYYQRTPMIKPANNPQPIYQQIIEAAVQEFENHVIKLNTEKKSRIEGFLKEAVGNCIANAGYHFLDPNGPKWTKISEKTPIVWRYFTEHPYQTLSPLEEIEAIENSEVSCHFKACNGWIMGDDPLRNFAEPGSLVYLKRELIVWGDSVKLRFGKCREDSPYLWDRIEQYCAKTAEVFDGIRLDNCHSTPLHVAEFAVDTCRRVKSNFYVMAELFTGREDIDMIFVNRLGITSLIREAMSAYNCRELGRQIHRYGGRPVGAFYQDSSNVQKLQPSLPHALFMDYTHDNQPSAVQKRHPVDLLASAAAVAMGCYGTGSSRGYDDMVPHYIDIVSETRLYPKWNENGKSDDSGLTVDAQSGIIAGKRLVNELHQTLASGSDNCFDQVYVDQVTDDVITVTRHNSQTHESVIAAIRTAFDPSVDTEETRQSQSHDVRCLNIPGQVTEIILEASTILSDPSSIGKLDMSNFEKDESVINGLDQWAVRCKQNIQVAQSEMVCFAEDTPKVSATKLKFKHFKPGSIVVFKVELDWRVGVSLRKLHSLLSSFDPPVCPLPVLPSVGDELSVNDNLQPFDFSSLSLVDMNILLFRCGAEEQSTGMGLGPYNIPGYGDMKYCGLAGLHYVMEEAVASDDLGHPLCENIRNGNWLVDYSINRLKLHQNTHQVGVWLESVMEEVKQLPRYLIPSYLHCIISSIYTACVREILCKMGCSSEPINSLKSKLLLGSVQLVGVCRSAPLAPVLLNNEKTSFDYVQKLQGDVASLSAGLPHFSEGIWRNWGRDTFIALRGLLLLTNRRNEAKNIILSYAATMRHGLIPNLLGGGSEVARYNCRDAFWWWLNSIRHYCQSSECSEPDIQELMGTRIARIYPDDFTPFQRLPTDHVFCTLAEIIQEGLQRHAEGIRYIERKSGPQIDSNMSQPGFTVDVYVDAATGFVIGGNKWNCGTWMDKMGSSDLAGNRGFPATPRDGASVELQGLCFSCVKWLAELSKKPILFPYEAVKIQDRSLLTFSNWANKLKHSFDCHFFIECSPNERYHDLALVNKKQIYRDTLGSQNPWTDYQLRPNYSITLAEAADMCDPEKAWEALNQMELNLLGFIGMKTLDPSDWKYNGVYDNDRDDANYDLAKGFNYHNGPEWVWVSGFFYRAKLACSQRLNRDRKSTAQLIGRHLSRISEHIDNSSWRGVTELTNGNGALCPFSSPTQAWSFATALELIHDVDNCH